MKTIIVVSARGETGKTSSIVGLSKSFPIEGKKYYYQDGWHDQPEFPDDDKRDVLCYGEYGDKRVGFSSEGDYVRYVVKCIERLVGEEVEIMIVASRLHKTFKNKITECARRHGYEVIWTSHYHWCGKPEDDSRPMMANGTDLNGLFAEHFTDIIKQMLR